MADASPGLEAEIQKFEQKHGENPEGRYFVPLANAYRKNGDLEHAEGLLREGLKHHPDYLSAHIVLARCLADRGALGEAEEEFRRVIAGDPQNLVALRALGDLAAAAGRRAEAASWYEQLLAIDPMSSEGREALDALRSSPEQPLAQPGEQPSEQPTGAWLEEPPGLDREQPEEERATELPGLDVFGGEGAGEGGEDEEPAFAPLDLDSAFELPPAMAEEQQPEAPAGFDSFDPGELDQEQELGPELGLEPELETGTDAPGSGSPPRDEAPAPEFSLDVPDFEPSADAASGGAEVSDEAEVVTETIAELYAAQGFRDRALEVYRELVRRRGEEPALLRRIAELERSGATPSPEGPDSPAPGGEDPFADSFAHGFAGAEGGEGHDHESPGGSGEAGDRAGAAAGEEAGEGPEPGQHWELAEAGEGAGAAAPAVAEGEGDMAGDAKPRTVGSFFRSLLAWTPGAGGSDATADHAEEGDPLPAEEAEPEDEDAFPWEAAGDDLPWESSAPAEDAPSAAPPEASAGPAGGDPAAEPAAEEEPAPRAAPAAEAEPAPGAQPDADEEPAPAAAPGDATGGDTSPPPAESASDEGEAEDLESFQSWLRSLKR